MSDNKHNHPCHSVAAVRYDTALRRSQRLHPLPPDCLQPQPQPTSHWPPENVQLLERYRQWLIEGGSAQAVINQHRIPMAGHVLGLNLKPHRQLNLTSDLDKAMAYVQAKKQSQSWTKNCRHSLDWFRRFLRQERGLVIPNPTPRYGNAARYQEGLPDWLLSELEKFLLVRQVNWRPSRLAISTYQFWRKVTQVWRWLFANTKIQEPKEITRRHLYTYMDEMLAQGYAVKSVNQDLYNFQATLRFLQRRGQTIPNALLNLSGLKQPDSLPRFLTDEQVQKIHHDLTQRVAQASTPARRRDSRLDLAAFYLLWQGGLRVCEVEDLALSDLNLPQQRLLIRQSKGLKDRAVYLTEAAIEAIQDYLTVRGSGSSDNLFLYRHKPLSKDLIRCRLKAAGERTGVKVTPHMLRHTFATQLVNAGCKITTIQALLGHSKLNSTMIYARVHDQTVAKDYYTAMTNIEAKLAAHLHTPPEEQVDTSSTTANLLTLLTTLQNEPLTTSQQATIHQLQCGLLSLADTLNTEPMPLDQIVNEQQAKPQLPVEVWP